MKLHYRISNFKSRNQCYDLLQVWPTFKNVTVNTSLEWDEITRVGNFDVFEYIRIIVFFVSPLFTKKPG